MKAWPVPELGLGCCRYGWHELINDPEVEQKGAGNPQPDLHPGQPNTGLEKQGQQGEMGENYPCFACQTAWIREL